MPDGTEKTVARVQTFVPVEQSMSIDPHLDREKQQDGRRPKKNRILPTVQDQLQDEQSRWKENENNEHVDYHA